MTPFSSEKCSFVGSNLLERLTSSSHQSLVPYRIFFTRKCYNGGVTVVRSINNPYNWGFLPLVCTAFVSSILRLSYFTVSHIITYHLGYSSLDNKSRSDQGFGFFFFLLRGHPKIFQTAKSGSACEQMRVYMQKLGRWSLRIRSRV